MDPNGKRKSVDALQEERWNAKMEALEVNWQTRISAACAEFQQVRARLDEKRLSAQTETVAFLLKA